MLNHSATSKDLIAALQELRNSLKDLSPKELKKLERVFMECDSFADTYLYYLDKCSKTPKF